jgi:hypothetical protein
MKDMPFEVFETLCSLIKDKRCTKPSDLNAVKDENMMPIPLNVAADSASSPTETSNSNAVDRDENLTVSEALANLLGQEHEQERMRTSKESSETTNLPKNSIVDITDQYVGKSLIITGAKKSSPTR